MRLVFCLFRYSPFSGLARDMLRIADAANRRGHHVQMLAAAWEGESSKQYNAEVIPVSGITNHGRAANFAHAMQAKLSALKYDKVIGFNKTPGLDVYYAADPCFAARARYSRRMTYRLTPRYRNYHELERAVFQAGAHTHNLVLSERAKDEYQEFYGTEDERFTVLPPNLSMSYHGLAPDKNAGERVRRELGMDVHENLVLMVGSGFRTKAVDRAILALAALPPDLRLTTRLAVVGQGKAQPFTELARRNGIQKQVCFLGGRNDVPDLMRAATLLTHPAYNENTGTVLLEAMAAGLPVLTTDICGYAHHVRAAQAGLVLNTPFNQTEFNAALEQALCADPRQWSENGRRYVQDSAFFGMPEAAVEAIEQCSTVGSRETEKRGDFFYLSNQLNFEKGVSFDHVMDLRGEVFRQAPGRRTLRIVQGGNGYFLKTHHGVGWREIFKNLLYLKRPVLGADNEWHALHYLGRFGVKVPAPLGFGRSGLNPARRNSFVIMEEIRDAISLEELIANKGDLIGKMRVKRTIISGLASTARAIHSNGANHRDFYLCHFLINRQLVNSLSSGSIKDVPLMLIDLHRVQIRLKTPKRWIVKDLGGLYYSAMKANVTRRDLLRFIKIYCAAPLRTALTGPIDWKKVQARADALQRADKTARA